MGADELRIAVIFRGDIEIPRGKSAAQFGHAIALLMADGQPEIIAAYMANGAMKLSMEASNLVAIESIARRAKLRGVPCVIVYDAGRTGFDGTTVTCIGLGPMNKTDCNALTRSAKMRFEN